MVPKQGMSSPAWAQATAWGLWVWTMPPTPGKARYSSRWVLVSLEGFHLPSATLPVSSSTTTMSSAVMPSYSTPEGLMTIRPLSRSIPDTLPQVKVTRPYLGRRRLASKTACLSASNIVPLL